MNEKIWELAKQAGAETWSRPPFRAVTGVAFTDGGLQKFAELIVRECANYAYSDDQDHKAMLKHFGVEE